MFIFILSFIFVFIFIAIVIVIVTIIVTIFVIIVAIIIVVLIVIIIAIVIAYVIVINRGMSWLIPFGPLPCWATSGLDTGFDAEETIEARTRSSPWPRRAKIRSKDIRPGRACGGAACLHGSELEMSAWRSRARAQEMKVSPAMVI
eukprot:s196_g12.t2